MAEMLVLNPVGRRRRRKSATKTRRRRNPIAAVARRRPARRRNPIAAVARRRRPARRRNPIALRRAARRSGPRRRRNPIGLALNAKSIMRALGEAATAGAGAIAFDFAWNKVATYLPATMHVMPGAVGVGDGVKALATVVLGALFNKPTKGLAGKAAAGALTIQARDVIAKAFPTIGMQTGSLGYSVPGRVINASANIGPNRNITRVGAYLPPGVTPLLNGSRVGAYLPPGVSPLLNGLNARQPAAMREGNRYR